MVARPWPPDLLAALVSEFRAAGIDAIGTDQLPDQPQTPWLEGDVRDFSTESRWTSQAHISAVVRVRAPNGQMLVQKKIEAQDSGYHLTNANGRHLEKHLNQAFQEFVRKVANDPDILARLREGR